MSSELAPAWNQVGILDLVTIVSGQVDPRAAGYRDLPLIAPDHLESGSGRLLDIKTASQQRAISGKYLVEPGDVIYSKIRPYLRKAHLAEFECLCSADMYALRPKAGVDGGFVLHTLLSKSFTDFAIAASMRSGIPKINRTELAEFRLLSPGAEQQQAIGSALSDVDLQVARLEELTIKKREMKQGILQSLMSGRIRLPGFSEPWQESVLGRLAQVVGGGTPSTSVPSFWGGSVAWFTPAEISRHGSGLVSRSRRRITEAGLRGSSANLLPPGTVLVTSRATIGHTAVTTVPSATNQGFASLIPLDPRSTWFLYYWVQYARQRMEALSSGSTFLEISARKFAAMDILAPSLEEQASIAEVLEDVDAEIATLERQLESARAVREGMMQALLAGRMQLSEKVLT